MQEPDFFAFADRLVERLKLTCDEPGMKWFTSDDTAEVEKRAQFAPAIHVVYGGYRPTGEARGRRQEIEQTWIVIRSVKSAAGGTDRRVKAGPALGQILTACLGWPKAHRDEQHGPLRLVSAPGVRRVGTVDHYPLAFVTTLPVEGLPD